MVKGISGDGSPLIIVSKNSQRNDKCFCGSGLKVKNCCGIDSDYFLSGSALERRLIQNAKNEEDKKIKQLRKQVEFI